MFKFIVDWFGKKPDPRAEAPAVQPEAAPYKVEPPVQVAPTTAPVLIPQLSVGEPKPKRKPAAKKAPVAAMKAPAKPRAPKKPRAK